MVILPQLQMSLNFVAFLGNLIHLHHINTILILHDLTYRDQIGSLIETLQPRYDVTWMLVNEYNPEHWKIPIFKHDNILILTALEHKNILPVLKGLYDAKKLSRRSKNLIISSDFSKYSIETMSALHNEQINAVLVDWTLAELVIYAWNPYSVNKFIELNETEFFGTTNTDVTNRKYSGLFFDQLQSTEGKPTDVFAAYDSKNIFKVISRSTSVASIDGLELRIVDLIGEAIQSPMEIFVIRPGTDAVNETKLYANLLERTYSTCVPVLLRKFKVISIVQMSRKITKNLETADLILMEGYRSNFQYSDIMVYPHGFEQFVIVVENNTTTTATALQQIANLLIIYLWLLAIFAFVMVRCGLQWLIESDAINGTTKRKRCVFMCQDTIQLSCNIVMNTKQFASQRYRHTLLAHVATIIPLIAGMFLSGLLYGDYLIHSETPDIDSIAQLENSNLTIYAANYIPETEKFASFKNKIILITNLEVLEMISSGNTRYAYIIPEHWSTVVNMEHLKPNGRPLFYVIKERFGGKIRCLDAHNWYLHTRINTIMMRLHEHGFVNYFESLTKRIVEQKTTEMQSNAVDTSIVVAEAGEIQEILISCGIYLVGIFFAIVIFIVEYFSKKDSQ